MEGRHVVLHDRGKWAFPFSRAECVCSVELAPENEIAFAARIGQTQELSKSE